MKAIVRDRYGRPEQVLRFEDVPVPDPDAGEVRVRVEVAGVNPADAFLVTGRPWVARIGSGLRRPTNRVPGRVLTGVVDAVGSGVKRFAPGDAVFGQWDAGAYAEYAVGAADRVALRPEGLGPEAAVALPLAGVTALQGLRDAGGLEAGDRVLVNGAAGGIGTIAVQLATAAGAEVTAVCAADAVDLVRAIGAHHVIDYTTQDLAAGPGGYDLVFDLVGNRPIRSLLGLLTDDGVYVPSGGPDLGLLARATAMSIRHRGRVMTLLERENAEDLDHLAGLVVAGDLVPVIDRRWSLDEVPAAIATQGAGHARGKSIVTIG